MKRIGITYGTYDLLHNGHIRLLERAKAQVDYLIVGVTSDPYDYSRGKMNVRQSQDIRMEQIRETGIADLVISEEYEGQKIDDIRNYKVDQFIIGDDWLGKFDYLKEYTEVCYLERTKDISSTQIRESNTQIVQLGIVGTGRIAERFFMESKYVSGVHVAAVYSDNAERAHQFSQKHDIHFATNDYSELLEKVDAVYIAKEHRYHFALSYQAMQSNKHVLVEKPMVLAEEQAHQLAHQAKQHNLILKEAIKTAYCPGFKKVIELARTGVIGKVINIDVAFSSIRNDSNSREMDPNKQGGSLNEFGSYTLLPIVKLLGTPLYLSTKVIWENEVDGYLKVEFEFPGGKFATMVNALCAKTKGDLRITGDKGYIYVPDPWWKTTEVHVCYEDSNRNQIYHYNFDGDGLRYELSEFVKAINDFKNHKSLSISESLTIADTMGLIRDNLSTKFEQNQHWRTVETKTQEVS